METNEKDLIFASTHPIILYSVAKNAYQIIICAIFIISCANNNVNISQSQLIKMGVSDNGLLSDSIIHSFIPLETKEECLIGSISDVKIFEDRIFVMDGYKSIALYVFDLNGKFLSKVGRKGSGVGEYMNPRGFYIDSISNTILINDVNNKRLLHYDLNNYDFKFAKTMSDHCVDFGILEDRSYLFYSIYGFSDTGKERFHLQVCDSLMNPLKTFREVQIVNDCYYSLMNRNIYKVGNKTFTYHNQIPIVYEITSEKIEKKYKFVFDSFEFPSIDFMNDKKNVDVSTLLKSGFISGYMVCESNDLLCIMFTRDLSDFYYGIHNKKSKKNYLYTAKSFAKSFGLGLPFYLKGATDEYIIGVVSPSFIRKPQTPNAELQTIMDELSSEDNPVLTLFKWKS